MFIVEELDAMCCSCLLKKKSEYITSKSSEPESKELRHIF